MPTLASPMLSLAWRSLVANRPNYIAAQANRVARAALDRDVDLLLTRGDNLPPESVALLRRSGVQVALLRGRPEPSPAVRAPACGPTPAPESPAVAAVTGACRG